MTVPLANLFKTRSFPDPVLGPLVRTRGQWRGAVALGHAQPIPLAVLGSGSQPDPAALATARQLSTSIEAWRPTIAQALHEHLVPYRDALADEPPSARRTALLAIERPEQVWAHVSLQAVAIIRLGGQVTAELAYAVAWDDDHIVGARFQSNRFLELCGSIAPA